MFWSPKKLSQISFKEIYFLQYYADFEINALYLIFNFIDHEERKINFDLTPPPFLQYLTDLLFDRMHSELNHDIKVPDIEVLMQRAF